MNDDLTIAQAPFSARTWLMDHPFSLGEGPASAYVNLAFWAALGFMVLRWFRK